MRIFKIIMALSITTIIGFILGTVYVSYDKSAERFPWKSLGKPPEKPIRVLTIGTGIYVLTESEAIYYYTEPCKVNCWWEAKNAPDEPDYYDYIENCSYPSLPKQYIDEKHYCVLDAADGGHNKLVLITMDGEVLLWIGYFGGHLSFLEWVLCPGCGAIAFLILPIVIYSAIRNMQKY